MHLAFLPFFFLREIGQMGVGEGGKGEGLCMRVGPEKKQVEGWVEQQVGEDLQKLGAELGLDGGCKEGG